MNDRNLGRKITEDGLQKKIRITNTEIFLHNFTETAGI